jgi:hypothetical protein
MSEIDYWVTGSAWRTQNSIFIRCGGTASAFGNLYGPGGVAVRGPVRGLAVSVSTLQFMILVVAIVGITVTQLIAVL